ncbi:MAG: hypothetical protein NC394_09035 [Bacteroides sp.]|nr:hypothetical protein [Bacteroides sp.]
MSQNFSLDDILAEIDAKKSGAPVKSGDVSKKDLSVTSIINSDELKAAAEKASKKPAEAASSSAPQKTGSKDYSVTAIINSGELRQKEKEKDKERKREKPITEKKPKLVDRTARIIMPNTETAPIIKPAAEEKPAKKQEYDTEQRKLINTQLQAEEDFDDPDELIDAINPYEVKSRAADLSAVLGGDTLGIAGNDLKQLAESSHKEKVKLTDDGVRVYGGDKPNVLDSNTLMFDADAEEERRIPAKAARAEAATLETTAPVRKYIPQKEKAEAEKKAQQPPRRQTEKERRSNDALLEKLNLALSRKRAEEEEKKRTLGLSGAANKAADMLKAPTNGLNLDDERVIMATGVIPDTDVIKEKSKRKLRDFVMENDEDEEDEQEEDFDSYDSTGQIWADLCESHKVIKIRFFILFALTVFMFFVALMGDLNKGMVFDLFGFDVAFLDRRADAQGFLFYNLILGVVSAALCSSVLYNGIVKLFKLKADCDSVCAVTALTSIIATAVNIVRSDDIILSRSYVYIPAAIAGLMFNTLGKLMMVTRAKRNFRFISGDTAKYSAIMVESQSAAALTKGVAGELPCLAAMRKTELLTDFLKSSYGEDKADRLSVKAAPIAVGVSLIAALIAFFIPYGTDGLQGNLYWALTVLTAVMSLMTPFSMMFMVNVPLTRAGRSLAKSESVVLGYGAAEEFSETNSVMVDASVLFPGGTIIYSNIKHCKQPNSINNIALDQAIILAASLAIKSGSAMSNMFKDMINDKEDILVKVENCVYEDNLGILGWYGNKRMIMGSREQMKHHDIKVPDMKKVKRYAKDTTEIIYLSVAGEVVIMFFVELKANPNIKTCLQQLTDSGVSLVVKTTDSIITVAKIAEVFEIPPESVKILPYSMHELFYAFTRYTSRGSGAVSCNGTFSGFANAVLAAKRLIKDINLGMYVMLGGALIGTVAALAAAFTGNTQLLAPSVVIGWNTACLLLTVIVQSIRRY